MKRFSCVCLALALVAALGISPAVAAASELDKDGCRRVPFFADAENLPV